MNADSWMHFYYSMANFQYFFFSRCAINHYLDPLKNQLPKYRNTLFLAYWYNIIFSFCLSLSLSLSSFFKKNAKMKNHFPSVLSFRKEEIEKTSCNLYFWQLIWVSICGHKNQDYFFILFFEIIDLGNLFFKTYLLDYR